MIESKDKRKLFWLIDKYLSEKISAWSFCQEYHECYDTDLDLSVLTDKEYELFSELSIVASRFSPYQEDIKNYPGVYYTHQELRQKVMMVKNELINTWPTQPRRFITIILDGNRENYSRKDASDEEMSTLGFFLAADIRCERINFFIHWSSNNTTKPEEKGTICLLKKRGDYIYIADQYPTKTLPAELEISRRQFVQLLDDWRDKVCKKRPKEVIIVHENGEFWIETKN